MMSLEILMTRILLLIEKVNDSDTTQEGKVVIENNHVFKENNNKKGNNFSSTYMA